MRIVLQFPHGRALVARRSLLRDGGWVCCSFCFQNAATPLPPTTQCFPAPLRTNVAAMVEQGRQKVGRAAGRPLYGARSSACLCKAQSHTHTHLCQCMRLVTSPTRAHRPMDLEVTSLRSSPISCVHSEDWKRVSPTAVQRMHGLAAALAVEGAVIAPSKFLEGLRTVVAKTGLQDEKLDRELWCMKATQHVQAVLKLLRTLKCEESCYDSANLKKSPLIVESLLSFDMCREAVGGQAQMLCQARCAGRVTCGLVRYPRTSRFRKEQSMSQAATNAELVHLVKLRRCCKFMMSCL